MYGPFYSTKAATGLIMATGTVGQYLQEGDQINTFFTRDAGLTWKEVRKGSHIYEFGDHGGLIVMADDMHLTNTILYSWDEGATWSELRIADEKFQVENIIIEPTSTSQVFIVYGWLESSGVLVFLDFSELHTRECQGIDAPDTDRSDYETWTPSDHRLSGKCLMGHKVSYSRRKAERPCFNPETYERQISYENCPCVKEDFECDYGFQRQEMSNDKGEKSFDGPCVKDENPLHFEPVSTDQGCSDFKLQTRGYRRVAGDTCVAGESSTLDPLVIPCPTSGSSFGKIVLILLLLVAVTMFIVSLNSKYGMLDKIINKIRQLFFLNYIPIDQQFQPETPDDDHHQKPSHFLDEEEYTQSALLINGGKDVKKDKNSGKDSEFKPLPPKSGSDVQIPVLSPPRSGDNEDEFNPRREREHQ